MTSKELVKRSLENWKFPILDETENTIAIRYQMSYVHITSLHNESQSVAVLLTNVFSAENEREERLGLKTCNELNYRMMRAKFYIDDDNDLVVSAEFYYATEEEFEAQLSMALDTVISGKKRFNSQYKEIEAEDKLIQELNEQE